MSALSDLALYNVESGARAILCRSSCAVRRRMRDWVIHLGSNFIVTQVGLSCSHDFDVAAKWVLYACLMILHRGVSVNFGWQ